MEKKENIFRFWDNFISKCCHELALQRREYLLLSVNGLTNSRKILHVTEREFFNPNITDSDQ